MRQRRGERGGSAHGSQRSVASSSAAAAPPNPFYSPLRRAAVKRQAEERRRGAASSSPSPSLASSNVNGVGGSGISPNPCNNTSQATASQTWGETPIRSVGRGLLQHSRNSSSSSLASSESRQPFVPNAPPLGLRSIPSSDNEDLGDLDRSRMGWQGGNLQRAYTHDSGADETTSVSVASHVSGAVVLVDDGVPSTDIQKDLLRVLALMGDERHLVAYDLYKDAKNRFALAKASPANMDEARKAGIIPSHERPFAENGGGRRGPILDYWMEKNEVSGSLAATHDIDRAPGTGEQLDTGFGTLDSTSAVLSHVDQLKAATAAAQSALSNQLTPTTILSTTPRPPRNTGADFDSEKDTASYTSLLRAMTPDAITRRRTHTNTPKSSDSKLSSSRIQHETNNDSAPNQYPDHAIPYDFCRVQNSDPGPSVPALAPTSGFDLLPGSPHRDLSHRDQIHARQKQPPRRLISEPLPIFTTPSRASKSSSSALTSLDLITTPWASTSYSTEPLSSLEETQDQQLPQPQDVPPSSRKQQLQTPQPSLKKQQSMFAFLQNKWRGGSSKDVDDKSNEQKSGENQNKLNPGDYDPTNMSAMEAAEHLLTTHQAEFASLVKRAKLFQKAKESLTVDDDWTLAQTLFGVTTHYRRESDGTLSIKLLGELSGVPLFEQLAVLRECDLYHLWAPFCKSSQKLAQLGKLDCVGWYKIHIPMLGTRDGVYRAMGCDTMREDGSIMIVAEGIQEDKHKSKERQRQQEKQHNIDHDGIDNGAAAPRQDGQTQVQEVPSFCSDSSSVSFDHDEERPPGVASNGFNKKRSSPFKLTHVLTSQKKSRKTKSGSAAATSPSHLDRIYDKKQESTTTTSTPITVGHHQIELPEALQESGTKRMTIRKFYCTMDILGPDSARTRMVVNIDPNLKLLPQNVVDLYTRRVGGILLLRLQAAARKIIADPRRNAHARRMRLDPKFYSDWLLPKFHMYCNELGWDMPRVSAFEVHRTLDSDDDEDDFNYLDGEDDDWDEDEDLEAEQAFEDDCNGGVGHRKRDIAAKKAKLVPKSMTRPFKSMQKKIDHGPDFLNGIKSNRAIEAEKKKKLAAARRKANRRLRAKPLNSTQRRRYQELERTKRKLESQEHEAEKQREEAAAKRRAALAALGGCSPTKGGTRSRVLAGEDGSAEDDLCYERPGRLETISVLVRGFADDLYWSAIWPVVGNIAVMFCLFYGDSIVSKNQHFHHFEESYRLLSAFMWMGVYFAVHSHMLFTICNVAFDAVEPHLSVGGSTKQSRKAKRRGSMVNVEDMVPQVSIGFFQQGRIFFLKSAKPICRKASAFVLLICSVYSFGVLVYHRYTSKIRFTINTNVTFASLFSGQTIISKNSSSMSDALPPSAPYDMMLEAVNMASETMSTDPMAASWKAMWKQTTLDSVRWVMSYTACFVALLIIFGVLLLDPQQKRQSHKEFVKKKKYQEQHASQDREAGTKSGGVGRPKVLKRIETFHQRNVRGMEKIHQRNMKNWEHMQQQIQQAPLVKGFENIHQRNVRNFEHIHQRNVRNWEHVKRGLVRHETAEPVPLERSLSHADLKDEYHDDPASPSTHPLGKLHQRNVKNLEQMHSRNIRNWEDFQEGIKRNFWVRADYAGQQYQQRNHDHGDGHGQDAPQSQPELNKESGAESEFHSHIAEGSQDIAHSDDEHESGGFETSNSVTGSPLRQRVMTD
jgi:hypothetical protein